MKRLKISIVALLTIMGVVIWLLPFSLYSASNPFITIQNASSTERTNIKKACDDVNSELKTADVKNKADSSNNLLRYSESKSKYGKSTVFDVEIEFNLNQYKNYSQQNKQKAMQVILTTIENSKISATNKTKIYNFVANSDSTTSSLVRQLNEDVRADYVKAYGIFAPFSGVLGTILGCITLGIFFLFGLTISVDLAYITIPAIQSFLNGVNKDGKDQKPKFVSLEAWKAVQAAYNDNEGKKDATTTYLKLKSKQLIAIAICLLYLVSGQIYNLIANLIDYFRGVIG